MIDKPIHISTRQKLKNISLKTFENYNFLFRKLTLERFIARIDHSNYKNHLIFKGGYCLNNIIEIGRETNDLDFLLKNLTASIEEVKKIFLEISQVQIDDGFIFENIKVILLPINKAYPGYRIELDYHFGSARDRIHIDIGVGDIVKPVSISLNMIRNEKGNLFNDQINILAYPAEFIFSEKLHAAIFRGENNSRLKDYHDIYLLIKSELLNIDNLKESLILTFENRNTKISLIPIFSDNIMTKFQNQWKKHLINIDNNIKDKLPKSFEVLVSEINSYLNNVI